MYFHNGVEWVEGYMSTATGDITLSSPEVNCTPSVYWYLLGGREATTSDYVNVPKMNDTAETISPKRKFTRKNELF